MGKSKQLRKMLNSNEFIILPGIYDCLSARIAEEAGFKVLFLSGGALSYSRLGQPDTGFLSLHDLSDAIQKIAGVVSVPLIADCDNGFGNASHAAHVAKTYEQVGASGLQIDDKVLPSRTPSSNEVIPWEEIAPKISAMRSVVSEDFFILFRTCANLYGYGIEESIRRINLAKDAGADFAYIDGLKSLEEIEKVSQEATIPLLLNLNEKGYAGSLPLDTLKGLAYRIGLFPISSMLAASKAMMEVLQELYSAKSTLEVREKMVDPPSIIYEMMGLSSLEEKYDPLYVSKK